MSADRVRCVRCDVHHAPELTHGACPVCGEVSDPSLAARAHAIDADTRLTSMAAFAAMANLLIFALILVAVLR